MKKLAFTFLFLVTVFSVFAQEQDTESEIRKLEQMEVMAVLQKDTSMLLTLWDEDFVVNAPETKINFAGNSTVDRPVLQRSRTSFTRDITNALLSGEIPSFPGAVKRWDPQMKNLIPNR